MKFNVESESSKKQGSEINPRSSRTIFPRVIRQSFVRKHEKLAKFDYCFISKFEKFNVDLKSSKKQGSER